MLRCLIAMAILGAASALHAEQRKDTYKRHGQTYCAVHHVPTVSIAGYWPSEPPGGLTLVHDYSPRVDRCWPSSPNRLPDDRSFNRTSIHTAKGIITFCPFCDADYRRCYGGDRRLSRADRDQIAFIVRRNPQFRKPIIRTFATAKQRAVAIGGHQARVDDVFSDIVLDKLNGRWVVVRPAVPHRIVAIGRDL